jgi:hypothetical protein
MAIVHIDYVINEMHECGLNCWNIRDGKSLLAEQDDDSKDISASAALLRDKLKSIGAGYVTINLSGVNKKNRKAAEALKVRTYTVMTGSSENNKSVIAPVAGYDMKELDKLRAENEQLKLQAVEHKYQSKLQELEKKIEGLESGDESGLGRVETLLLPIITNMFNNTATPAAPINGIEEESILDQWTSVDPEAIQVLEKIVGLAVNKPALYNQYKPILLSL